MNLTVIREEGRIGENDDSTAGRVEMFVSLSMGIRVASIEIVWYTVDR
jgi:hypothetical protein